MENGFDEMTKDLFADQGGGNSKTPAARGPGFFQSSGCLYDIRL